MNYRGRNKRKPYFSSNLMAKKKKDLFLRAGMKGFICTCNGNEKQCIRESYNILNEYADRLYGPEEVTKRQSNDTNPMEVDDKGDTKADKKDEIGELTKGDEKDEIDEFQKEVDALKAQHKESNKRFQAVDSGVANCIFIKTNLDDPVSLCDAIMRDIAVTKLLKARFLMRIVPIETTCKAQIDDIENAVGTLFDRYFKAEPLTYAIVISKRCNSSLGRDPLIEKLATMVQERNAEHKVNLSNPAITILIEAMKGICGIAVIRDYHQLSKYNLRQLCGLPLNDRGDGASASSSTLNLNQVDDAENVEDSSSPPDQNKQCEKNGDEEKA